MPRMKTVPVVSGGLDSVTMLWKYLNDNHAIDTVLSFDYHQRHRKELDCLKSLLDDIGITHYVVKLGAILEFGGTDSALQFGGDVPDGHYAEDSMKQTIVPGRNLVMLSIAASFAQRSGADAVAIAVHGGDHFIYPDCRPAFIDAAADAIVASTEHSVILLAPFLHTSKAAIVGVGAAMDVPFERTWSCYKGGEVHCGTCGTCVERREAFQLAGIDDPTVYAATPPIPAAPAR